MEIYILLSEKGKFWLIMTFLHKVFVVVVYSNRLAKSAAVANWLDMIHNYIISIESLKSLESYHCID